MSRAPWSLLLALAALGAAAAPASAQEPAKPPVEKPASDDEAKAALERFARDFATEDLDFRMEAIRRLRRTSHATVADRLVDLALKHADAVVRAEAFRALQWQKSSAKSLGPKVARWLGEAANENRKAKARGDYGVLVDVKTGETDTISPEGQAVLRAKKERGRMITEAVRLLRDWEYRDRDSVDVLTEFLQDGNDDLVALVLGAFGKWKEGTVLKDLLELYEMYPEEDSFQTGGTSVDTGAAGSADQAAAKRKWMAKYGDPDKRRPRPKVVKALKQALLDITGKEMKTPKDLRDWLKTPEGKRKEKGG